MGIHCMKKIKNPEKISLMFFLVLLILLPIILTSNTEEKIILSKAEESLGASPSAILIPTAIISPFPTLSATPITPTPLPTQQTPPSPTTIQPTPTSPSSIPSPISPTSSPNLLPSSFPSFPPSPFISPHSIVTPLIYPTKPQGETIIATDTTLTKKVNSFMQSTLQSFTFPNLPVEKASGFIGDITTVFDDIFGVYISSSQGISSLTDASVVPIEGDIHPTLNRNQYIRIELREKDLSPGFLTQWFDKLFKKERIRMITYTFIMNPDGFVYTFSPIVSIQASHGPFDEFIDRKKTLTNVAIGENNCFDRDGFFNNCNEAYTFYKDYPDNHHRIHTMTIVSMTGAETNKNTSLTFDQWDAMGLLELRDEQGLPLSSILRAQSGVVNTSILTMNELYDRLRLFTTKITRDQLVQLLAGDDRITLRIE